MILWQRSLSNGKPTRKVHGGTYGSPSSASSRRGSDRKRILTSMVLKFFHALSFFIMAKAVNAVVTSPSFPPKMLPIGSLGHNRFSFTLPSVVRSCMACWCTFLLHKSWCQLQVRSYNFSWYLFALCLYIKWYCLCLLLNYLYKRILCI